MGSLPCAGCRRPVQVVTGGAFDPIAAMQVFNRELERRGEQPLRRDQIALCDSCHAKWQIKRSSLQSEYTRRSHEEWLKYKEIAEASGRQTAEQQMPTWWASDAGYRDLRNAWHRKNDSGSRRKADSY